MWYRDSAICGSKTVASATSHCYRFPSLMDFKKELKSCTIKCNCRLHSGQVLEVLTVHSNPQKLKLPTWEISEVLGRPGLPSSPAIAIPALIIKIITLKNLMVDNTEG